MTPRRIRGGALPRAFTIIEILIAITILGMVMTSVYALWAVILKASRSASTAAIEVQRSRMTLRCLEESLTTAQIFMENPRHYAFLVESDSKFSSISFVSRLSQSFPGAGQFGDQLLRRVTFSVEPGKDGLDNLIMRQIPPLMITNSGAEAYELTLARDVREFLVDFWDPANEEWNPEWLTTNQLPRLVRVSLATGERGSKKEPGSYAQTMISIAATNVSASLQGPNAGGAVRRPVGGQPPPGPINNPGGPPAPPSGIGSGLGPRGR